MNAASLARRLALTGLALLMLGQSVEAAGKVRTVGKLPPPRPITLAGDTDGPATGSLAPVGPRAGAAPIVQAAAGDKLSDRQIVDRANAALNAVTSMAADFTQIGGDGRRETGLLYRQRPGTLGFQEEKSSTP